MSEKTNKLTPKQAKGIKALLTESTIDKAAGVAGVNPRTINRWLTDPDFVMELRAQEGQAIDRTSRRLISLLDKSLDAIEDIIDNPEQRGATNKRLAAQVILDQMSQLRELRNTEQRLADLEAAIFNGQH